MYLLNKRRALTTSSFPKYQSKKLCRNLKNNWRLQKDETVSVTTENSLWLTGWPSAGASLRWWATQKCQPACSQGFCNCFQMDACAKLKKKKKRRRRRKMNLLLRNFSYNNFALQCSHSGIFLGKHDSLYSG